MRRRLVSGRGGLFRGVSYYHVLVPRCGTLVAGKRVQTTRVYHEQRKLNGELRLSATLSNIRGSSPGGSGQAGTGPASLGAVGAP